MTNLFNTRFTFAAALASIVLVTASGCAVTRGQESVGAYVDDTAITTAASTSLFSTKRAFTAVVMAVSST